MGHEQVLASIFITACISVHSNPDHSNGGADIRGMQGELRVKNVLLSFVPDKTMTFLLQGGSGNGRVYSQ